MITTVHHPRLHQVARALNLKRALALHVLTFVQIEHSHLLKLVRHVVARQLGPWFTIKRRLLHLVVIDANHIHLLVSFVGVMIHDRFHRRFDRFKGLALDLTLQLYLMLIGLRVQGVTGARHSYEIVLVVAVRVLDHA